MHGLRCDPALLGWTRLLDEWVVGLMGSACGETAELVCWDDPGRTLGTLADAATGVRSFAYREMEIEPTRIVDDAVLRIELQGRAYCVAADQYWPGSAEIAISSAVEWLDSAQQRARRVAEGAELAVAAVFVTPRLPPATAAEARFGAADSFIAASRAIRCSGCAFSFPLHAELDRYRYGNDEHPGALLLVQPAS